jgi:hypothetical protein
MKAQEFGGWKWRAQNIVGREEYTSYDEFNTFLKKERRPDPPEYASRDVEEYKQFSETRDESDLEVPKKDGTGGDSGSKSDKSRQARRKMLQQVVGLVAGSAVLVGTYNAVESEQAKAAEEPSEVIEITEPTIDEPIEEDPKGGGGKQGGESQPTEPSGQGGEQGDPGQSTDPTEEEDPCEVNGHTYEEVESTSSAGKITIRFRCSECGEEKELVITYDVEPEE